MKQTALHVKASVANVSAADRPQPDVRAGGAVPSTSSAKAC